MKYIKLFELFEKEEIIEKILIPGMMYHENHADYDICFVGYNNDRTGFNLTCFIFRKTTEEYDFIEWATFLSDSKYMIPLNMTIEEYIIHNNKIDEVLKAFKRPKGQVGSFSRKLIKGLYERVLRNEEIQLRLFGKNYNL